MSEFEVEPAASAAIETPLAEGVAAGEAADAGEVAAEPTAAAPFEEPQLDALEVQAELDYVREQNQELIGYLDRLAQAQATGGREPQAPAGLDPAQLVDEFGNLNPNALAQMLDSRNQALLSVIDQRLQQVSAPLAAQAEAERTASGEARLADMVSDDVARNGEFASDPQADAEARELVRTVAEQMFPEVAARYGETPRAAEIAMSRASDRVRTLLRTASGEGQTQQANRLATLAGAATETNGGAGGTMNGEPAFTSPSQVTDHYAARAAARRTPQAL